MRALAINITGTPATLEQATWADAGGAAFVASALHADHAAGAGTTRSLTPLYLRAGFMIVPAALAAGFIALWTTYKPRPSAQ